MDRPIGTLDLGGTSARFGRTAVHGEVEDLSSPRPSPRSFEEFLQTIRDIFPSLSLLSGFSFCVPAPVGRKGEILRAPNLPWLSGCNLRQMLESEFRKPVLVINDMVAAAIGEAVTGELSGSTSGMMITLSTGIGAAVVERRSDGSWRVVPTELGHYPHPEGRGEKCGCGKSIGCFEALHSGAAVRRRLQAEFGASINMDICAFLDDQATQGIS